MTTPPSPHTDPTSLDAYPMKTLAEAKSSLETLISRHTNSELGVADYRSLRNAIQSRIAELTKP